ncbi:MAG: sugar phosphate isomerase/epimerase family protein [Acidimicrobiia bacterium]
MADRFGCRHVQAVGSLGEDLGRDAVERFAALCDLAGAHGLLVALEFIPCTNVPDAAAAMEIVQSADRVNGGLCVDIWHHVRGANDLGQLGAIPRERIVVVQLDDGPLVAADDDYMEDTRYNRVATGEGEFDLTAFLMVFEGAGAPISVEVLSRELDAVDVAVAARRIGDGARNVLRAAQRGRSVHQQS